jgi:hypothetical protein
MTARLRGTCEAFEVTVDEPQRGDDELRIDVVFVPDGPTDAATIELRLYSRRLGWVIRSEDRWDREASVPGTRARLERGRTGRLSFTRPLPPFVTAFTGTGLEIGVVLVTEGDDGSKLRLLLDAPPVAEDAYLVVRGLPLEERLRSVGLLRSLRGDRPTVKVEPGPSGTVAVTVAGAAISGGLVRLEAVEFEHNDGADHEWDPPIAATEAVLTLAGTDRLRANLPLPAATAAPASIKCSWGSDTQAIRWYARFELEDSRGRVTRGEIPLHVGVERGSAPGATNAA